MIDEVERLRRWLQIISMSGEYHREDTELRKLRKQYLSDEVWWAVKSRTEKDFRQWLAYQALEGKEI